MDIFAIIIYSVVLLIIALITRWIFSITRIVNILEDQRHLLLLMAEKMGIDDEKLLKITNPEKYAKIQHEQKRNEYYNNQKNKI